MKLNKKIALGATLGVLATMLGGCGTLDRMVENWNLAENGSPQEIIVYDINGKKIFEDKGKFNVTRTEKSFQYVDDNNNRKHSIFFDDNNAVVVVREISESELNK